ncbi:DMT family transporter [Caviibacterium pharyngocola]|uniref:EamA/RhaT family transporter n=1 Tax=Caviibacterium pharyngocola TaxID=28159 RepID=A0A2M8RXU0_9PAST|nr:DMT family transporter [Caviibacterium pharyngocola]PJG83709.1 EamA/RhaT family transporter [Caviibacterium pharyngocola]
MMQKLGYGYFCLIIATLFWGGNYMFGKMLSREIAPIILNYARWFPAALILLLLFGKRLPQFSALIGKNLPILTALALLGVVIFPVFLYQGLQTTTALNASIYLAVVPIVVLFLNRLVFGDPIRPQVLIGALISFIGVLWLLSHGEPSRLLAFNVNTGDLWAIGSAISWAIYCCIIRFRPAALPNAVMLTSQVVIAMLLFTPVFAWQYLQIDGAVFSAFTANQWWIILYLIIGPSILSYGFWNYGMSIVGGTKGAAFTNATPLFAAVLGILILQEPLYVYHIISALLIIFGLVLCNRK